MCSGDTYDLREGSFQEGWEKFMVTVLDKKATRQTKCRACDLKNMCGMCPVNGQLECLDPETPVDFLCRVSHLRAYSLGLSVSPHGNCAYCVGGREYEAMMETVAALQGERVE